MTDDHLLCRVPRDLVERYAELTECVAFRFVKVDETTVEIVVTNDLELATRPEDPR